VQTSEADINKDEQTVPSSIHTVAGVVPVTFVVACFARTDQARFDCVLRQRA
jgi:hypothetical protein